jgi:hypothetical protein
MQIQGRVRRLEQQDALARGDTPESLSLHDTARELGLTAAGFIGVIVLIITAVRFVPG